MTLMRNFIRLIKKLVNPIFLSNHMWWRLKIIKISKKLRFLLRNLIKLNQSPKKSYKIKLKQKNKMENKANKRRDVSTKEEVEIKMAEEVVEEIITNLKMLIQKEKRKTSSLSMPLRRKKKRMTQIQVQILQSKWRNSKGKKGRNWRMKGLSLLEEKIQNQKQGIKKIGMSISMAGNIQKSRSSKIDPIYKK